MMCEMDRMFSDVRPVPSPAPRVRLLATDR